MKYTYLSPNDFEKIVPVALLDSYLQTLIPEGTVYEMKLEVNWMITTMWQHMISSLPMVLILWR